MKVTLVLLVLIMVAQYTDIVQIYGMNYLQIYRLQRIIDYKSIEKQVTDMKYVMVKSEGLNSFGFAIKKSVALINKSKVIRKMIAIKEEYKYTYRAALGENENAKTYTVGKSKKLLEARRAGMKHLVCRQPIDEYSNGSFLKNLADKVVSRQKVVRGYVADVVSTVIIQSKQVTVVLSWVVIWAVIKQVVILSRLYKKIDKIVFLNCYFWGVKHRRKIEELNDILVEFDKISNDDSTTTFGALQAVSACLDFRSR